MIINDDVVFQRSTTIISTTNNNDDDDDDININTLSSSLSTTGNGIAGTKLVMMKQTVFFAVVMVQFTFTLLFLKIVNENKIRQTNRSNF